MQGENGKKFCRIPVVLESCSSSQRGVGGGCAPLHPPPSSAPKTPLSKYSHANLLLAATQNAKNKSQPTGGLFWEEVVSHLLFGREFIT